MSKPPPPFYDLEFSSDADFWAGSDASGRCVFLMPVSTPSQFLAFGVLETSKQVHFVVRGRLKEELAAFLTRMARGGVQVALYVRAPVPASILKRYTSGPPIEGQESEEPPAPSVRGLVPDPGTPAVDSLTGPLWTEGEVSARWVVVMPTHDHTEFFALGMLTSHRVLFRLRGSVREHLAEFVTRMVKEHARVELRPQFPSR